MVTNKPNGLTKLSWTHPWLQMNPMGYKIIMNPPMVTNDPNGLQNYHEPTHGYKWTQWVTKLSWTHPWLQMNPTGDKIIMNPPMVPNEPNGLQNYCRTRKQASKQASTRHNNKFKIMSHTLWRRKQAPGVNDEISRIWFFLIKRKWYELRQWMNEWIHID